MQYVHHRPIKRFSLAGQIGDDSSIDRLRKEYEKLVITGMRLSGYVQRLDIDTDFTIEYNHKTETFNFEISIYGVYVGKKKSKCIMGIDGTRIISTQKSRLSELSQDQGSPLKGK